MYCYVHCPLLISCWLVVVILDSPNHMSLWNYLRPTVLQRNFHIYMVVQSVSLSGWCVAIRIAVHAVLSFNVDVCYDSVWHLYDCVALWNSHSKQLEWGSGHMASQMSSILSWLGLMTSRASSCILCCILLLLTCLSCTGWMNLLGILRELKMVCLQTFGAVSSELISTYCRSVQTSLAAQSFEAFPTEKMQGRCECWCVVRMLH